MRKLATIGVLAIFFAAPVSAQTKDKIVVGTPDGSKIEVKVPSDLQVKQIGEHHYEIHRNDPALKQIEIKVIPPSKGH